MTSYYLWSDLFIIFLSFSFLFFSLAFSVCFFSFLFVFFNFFSLYPSAREPLVERTRTPDVVKRHDSPTLARRHFLFFRRKERENVRRRARARASPSLEDAMKKLFFDSIHRNSRLYGEGEKEGEMDGRTFRENDDARGSQRARTHSRPDG